MVSLLPRGFRSSQWCRGFLLLSCLLSPLAAPAQADSPAATGTVTGRVFNAVSGRAMGNARVFLDDARFVITDDYGNYRITGVPAGRVTITVRFTGFTDGTAEIDVAPGATVERDFALRGLSQRVEEVRPEEGEVIDLDEFVVESREVDATAIALQEQRYAVNLKNVVDADAFGDVTEGNVGEFVKYLPGVSVDYVAADVRSISVRGFQDIFTPVTVDGNRMASASSGEANRTFELEQVSMNNVARIELVKAPTPAMGADSLGGTVNLVSKNAFERRRAEFKYRTFLSINDMNIVAGRRPGPGPAETWPIRPGFDFTYTNPINKNFGIVVTGLYSDQFAEQHRSRMRYVFGSTSPAGSLPDWLRRYEYQDGPKSTRRRSVGLTADWRIRPGTVLSLNAQSNEFDGYFYNRLNTFDAGTTVNANTIRTPQDVLGWTNGVVELGGSARRKTGGTDHVALNLKHIGDEWQFDAGVYNSVSDNRYTDTENGHFERVSAVLRNVRVGFRDIGPYQPGTITVERDVGGGVFQPYDWTDLTGYRLRNTSGTAPQSARSRPFESEDEFRGGQFNVRKEFTKWSQPVSFQTGLSWRQQQRDRRLRQIEWDHIGADGFGNTADDDITGPGGNLDIADRVYVGMDPGWGMPARVWPDFYRTYQHYLDNPSWWRLTNLETNRQFDIQNSQYMKETVTGAYVQAETSFLQGKLRLLTGVRYERTSLYGEGALDDRNAIYQRDANGNLILDQFGQPIPLTNDSIERINLRYKERAAKASRSYDGFYPSFHLTYDIRDDLILRFSYARVLGRPNFSEIVPGAIIEEDPDEAGELRINANNPGLLPWESNSFDLSLEYYFRPAGVLSVGVFRKNIENFFGRITRPATEQDLEEFGIGPEFLGQNLYINTNVGSARISGVEVNFVRQLNFLPSWARGFSINANGTWLTLDGDKAADFRNFIQQSGNWGISFARGPVDIKLKWNYRGMQQREALAAPLNGFQWFDSRTYLDLNMEYRFSRRFTVFLNGRNILNKPQELLNVDPSLPDYAMYERREEFGVQWALGVKGTF